jgi:hypothetical protein
LLKTVPDDDLPMRIEVAFKRDDVDPTGGRAAWNLPSVSTAVGNCMRAEFCSRRFNTKRETRVTESLYIPN